MSLKIIAISLISTMLGLFLGLNITPRSPTGVFTESHNYSQYKYISPLLNCGNPPSNQYTDLKKTIQNKIDTYQVSHVSLYFRDLNNGPWFGINENELFSPSSLVKVPVMIAYYKLAQNDPSILSKKIVNRLPDVTSSQNIKPQKTIALNQEYTVQELIDTMIIYSDNNSYELLVQNIDDKIILNTFSDLGIDIDQAQENPAGNIISVKNYASFFRILYNASYLNPEFSSRALSLLTKTIYNQGIVAGVGQGVDISHKFGERIYTDTGEKQLHDCGIVFLPQKPYLICIMTRGNNFTHLTQAIKDISSTIYQSVKAK